MLFLQVWPDVFFWSRGRRILRLPVCCDSYGQTHTNQVIRSGRFGCDKAPCQGGQNACMIWIDLRSWKTLRTLSTTASRLQREAVGVCGCSRGRQTRLSFWQERGPRLASSGLSASLLRRWRLNNHGIHADRIFVQQQRDQDAGVRLKLDLET